MYFGHVGFVFFEDELSGDSNRSVENNIQLYWTEDGGKIMLHADHRLSGQDVLLSFDASGEGGNE